MERDSIREKDAEHGAPVVESDRCLSDAEQRSSAESDGRTGCEDEDSTVSRARASTAPGAAAKGPEQWPRCGARTRGARAGGRCKADGAGFGGRCRHHGGMGAGNAKERRLVLFSERSPGARWAWWAIPLAAWETLPDVVRSDPDPSTVAAALARLQRPSRQLWPQALGFPIVKLLATRDRLAFVVVHESNNVALRRAMRGEVFTRNRREPVHRIDADTFARAVSQAGQWPFKRTTRSLVDRVRARPSKVNTE